MTYRHTVIAAALIVVILVSGCGAPTPTATSIPAIATRIVLEPTHAALLPTFTPEPPTLTATPLPPTALPPATPTPAPLLSFEDSPQSFGRSETFQVGLGDLDGDGDLDAVFANMAAHDSQVWFNDGRGTFQDSGQKLTQQGHGLGLGDLDGDGDLDIFVTCAHFGSAGGWSKKPSKVYLNDGQGVFHDSGQDLGDAELSGNGVNLIDLDGDGDLDAHVIYYEVGGMPDRVYLNDGTGRFDDSGLALAEEEIAWGDLDADGDVDMLAKAHGQGYRVYLNDSTGQFDPGWQMEDSQAMYGDLALADLDGDGDLDALVASGFRSEGSFPTRLLWNDGGQFTDSGQQLNKTMGAKFAVGDLDGDGSLDVFVANIDRLPSEVWLNDGAGRLVDSSLRMESPSRHLATWPSLGDLDGDGDLDIVEAGFEGKAEVWLNRTQSPSADRGDGRTNTWIRTFEGPDYGAFFDITLTEDGNALAVGATHHVHMPPYSGDALFVKLTLDGEVLWEKTWGGDGYEQAWSVALAEEGGYYIFGETDSYGAGDRDFFLLKIAANGAEDWFKTYGRARREWPYGMLPLSNGDLLIYGLTEPDVGSGRNQFALRLGPDGKVIWEYTVPSRGEELVIDALETAEGDLVLAVIVEEDGQLVKLDAEGSVLWTNRYELAGWQYGSQIAQTDDGGFLLAGFSMSSGPRRQADTWLARCTPAGELAWETSFGDAAHDDYAKSLLRLKDGTYLIGSIGNGMLLSRVDQEGNVLWRRSLVGQTVYGAHGLIELKDGSYLVAGFIQIINGRSYDAILLRADAEGQIGALYLGQTPPGLDVELFAPGIVSIEEGKEYKITISPDLQEIFFTRRTPRGRDDRLWYSRLENDKLTMPELAPFTYDVFETDACFAPDGNRLYFKSARPLPGAEAASRLPNVWFVNRTETGWSEPQFAGSTLNDYQPVYFSIANDGTLYFTRSSPRGIYYAEPEGGEYREAHRLPDEVNSVREVAHPAIAPDESYLVVDSAYEQGGRLVGSLYVSFRGPDGSWTQAVSLHDALNATEADVYGAPRISPDGKYLFFERYNRATDRSDIYWVSTDVIKELVDGGTR